MQVLAEEKQQTLRINGTSDIILSADKSLLKQALLNLLDNAIKYSPEGSTITVCFGENASRQIFIQVIDQGPGILPEHQKKIFQRFYQVDKARSRELGGSGLGLAIARWSIEIQGSKINVQSQPGSGSTFTISFPPSSVSTNSPQSQTLFEGVQTMIPQTTSGALEIWTLQNIRLCVFNCVWW